MKITIVAAALLALVVFEPPGAFQAAEKAQEKTQEKKGVAKKPHDLARARSSFAGADGDKNNSLSSAEVVRAGYTERQFKVFDLDGDGALSSSEFVVAYKQGITGKGDRVAPDLENEARRVLAVHRAEQARRERERSREIGPAVRRRATVSTSSAEKKPPVGSKKDPIPRVQSGVAPPVLPPPSPGSGPARARIQEQVQSRKDPKQKEVPKPTVRPGPQVEKLGRDAKQGAGKSSSGQKSGVTSEKKGGAGEPPKERRADPEGGAKRSSTGKRDGKKSP